MSGVTRRLAVTGVSMDKIPLPRIFRIFSSVSNNQLVSVRAYRSEKTGVFAIAEFKNPEAAEEVYQLCDESEIEDTQQAFDLSFVADSFKLTEPIEECFDSSGFKAPKPIAKKADSDELPELSEELNELVSGIPEDIKSPKEKVEKRDNKILESIRAVEPADELDGFTFDATDPRFERIFTEKEFILDASSKLFKEQKESTEIVRERRRRMQL